MKLRAGCVERLCTGGSRSTCVAPCVQPPPGQPSCGQCGHSRSPSCQSFKSSLFFGSPVRPRAPPPEGLPPCHPITAAKRSCWERGGHHALTGSTAAGACAQYADCKRRSRAAAITLSAPRGSSALASLTWLRADEESEQSPLSAR
jgi:hypothetical protein